MAQKRMFDKKVVCSDKFIDLPNSSKALYFMAGMEADDKGFFQPRKLQRMCGFSDDDYKILIAKGFFITFESGVMVVTDWNKNNWLDKRRVSETEYIDELKLLKLINDKYELINDCLANAKPMLREYSIEENSIEENSIVVVDIYSIIEQNFGRTLNPIEYETITNWNKYNFPLEMLKYATTKAVLKNIYNISYIDKILYEWDKNNIRTLAQAQEEDKNYKPKRIYKTRQEKEEEAINKFLSEDD